MATYGVNGIATPDHSAYGDVKAMREAFTILTKEAVNV